MDKRKSSPDPPEPVPLVGALDEARTDTLEVHAQGSQRGGESTRSGSDFGLVDTDPGEPPGEASNDDKTFGRFRIDRTLGEGGMGTVLAAYDPRLERRVAIKVLRGDVWVGATTAGRERLLREARAMAKLSHPNVVTIHEVGELDDQVYIVMELVEGQTLTEWLAQEWSFDEIIEAFADAAAGLEAAHAVGLVHRDFKPDNVLVGTGGRVKVSDFGLASVRVGDESPGRGGAGALNLTASGAVLGTPLYMAPEQHLGDKTDARTDQFAFAVAVYHALCGTYPFAGKTYKELALNVTYGRMQEPASAELPERVRLALIRALSVDRQARFPSVAALVHELKPRLPARLRLPVVLAAAAVLAVSLAGGALALSGSDDGNDDDRAPAMAVCAPRADAFAGVWDPVRKKALLAAFVATGHGDAAKVFGNFSAGVDTYVADIERGRVQACEDTQVRREYSESIQIARGVCLDGLQEQLATVVEALSEPSISSVSRSPVTIGGLSSVATCADIESLSRGLPGKTPEQKTQWAELVGAVSRSRALRLAGKNEPALAEAEQAAKRAQELGWTGVEAEATFMIGDVQDRMGNGQEAIKTLTRAAVLATKSRSHRTAAEAYAALVYAYGVVERDFAKAFEMYDLADAALEAAGGDERQRAELNNYVALVHQYAGNFDDARRYYNLALAEQERIVGAGHYKVALVLNDLGTLERRLHNYDAARRAHERALAIRLETFGESHPYVVSSLLNLANVSIAEGSYDAAIDQYRHALSSAEQVYPANHPKIGLICHNLGKALIFRNRHQEAIAQFERAVAVYGKSRGEDDFDTVDSRRALAGAYAEAGRLKQAREQMDKAMAGASKALKLDRVEWIDLYLQDSELQVAAGNFAAASKNLPRSLELAQTIGPNSVEVAYVLSQMGQVEVARGRAKDAPRHLERALAILVDLKGDVYERATVRFVLARALWDTRRDRTRASRLVDEALADLEGVPADDKLKARILRWQHAHAH